MTLTKCDRCGARGGGGRNPNPARIRRYRIDRSHESDLCDSCRDLTAQYHEVEGVGRERADADPADWVHTGGGYYENQVTGDRRRGRPQ